MSGRLNNRPDLSFNASLLSLKFAIYTYNVLLYNRYLIFARFMPNKVNKFSITFFLAINYQPYGRTS